MHYICHRSHFSLCPTNQAFRLVINPTVFAMIRILITTLTMIESASASATGCPGIDIHSWAPYKVQETFEISEDRRGIRTTQCASVVVTLPGYYGKILDSNTTKTDLRERLFARMADGRAVRPNWIAVPDGRVDTAQRYRIRMCFGISRVTVADIGCR